MDLSQEIISLFKPKKRLPGRLRVSYDITIGGLGECAQHFNDI